MKCFHHAEVDATGYCRQCGKALCGECRRDVRGVVYCEDCLAALATAPAPAAPGAPNPVLAAVLGLIPGVGAIYNGEYAKALIHIIVFGGLVSLIDSPAMRGVEPLIGMLMFAFYVYMPVEAYQTAKRRAAGLATPSPGWEIFGGNGGKAAPIGPIVLIVLGALFLLNTMDFFPMRYVWRFWPVALIALGAWLLMKRTSGGER
jgi:TM2 domain-containing membrane protein YozV